MKKRDISLDYIRVIATIMIVVFHFASSFASEGSLFVRTANSTWGGLGTALFFLLSGFLLRKRHKDIPSVKDFYISRWISIFPPFYLAFIVAYLFNVIRLRSFFYQAPAYTLIYTLLGIDNLLKWFGVTSYAIVGEWFTGVIIILYILFPILNKIMKHIKWSATVVLTIVYVLGVLLGWYAVSADISFVSCTFIFWAGMIIADAADKLRTPKCSVITGCISIVLFFVLLFIYIPVPQVMITHLESILLFVSMYSFMGNLKEGNRVSRMVVYLSKTSYAVYLVHHFVVFVLDSSRKYLPFMNSLPAIAMFAMYIIIVLASSYVLWRVNNIIVMRIYRKPYN